MGEIDVGQTALKEIRLPLKTPFISWEKAKFRDADHARVEIKK